MEPEPDAAAPEMPTANAEPDAPIPPVDRDGESRYFHRIGGAGIENLRLKPKDAGLSPPGISVIQAPTPAAAAEEMRTGYPNAGNLYEQAKTIGSASVQAIEQAGFQVIPKRSRRLPNHHRIIHPNGAAGFNDENLARLAEAFITTTGH
jgi:hypothetical protein